MSPFSLYIHIPYCYHKCPYCDFNTYAVAQVPEKNYTTALLAELDARASLPEWRGRPIRTIFFGGGTPSLFSSAAIRKILVALARSFPLEDRVEITIEANPGSITIDSLMGYREAGINRISFGAQSFNTDVLKELGRMHTHEQIFSSVEHARNAGFSNISLDLIYAVPKQTVSDLRRDLEQAIELSPSHISAYGLTIEKGTPFYSKFKAGTLKLPQEEIVLEMMHELDELLPPSGYQRYEISNYAIPGREARHNLAYWEGSDYLGIGAGAHSFIRHSNGGDMAAKRWSNYALPAKYMKLATTNGAADSWRDKLSRDDLIFEFFFLGLRKIEGVNKTRFYEWFHQDMFEVFKIPIEMLVEQSFLKIEGEFLSLTERGLLVADSVVENFTHSSASFVAPMSPDKRSNRSDQEGSALSDQKQAANL